MAFVGFVDSGYTEVKVQEEAGTSSRRRKKKNKQN